MANNTSSSIKQPKISNESVKISVVGSNNLQPVDKSVLPIQQDDKPNPNKCSKSVKKSAIDGISIYQNWNTSGKDKDYRQSSR